MPYLSVNFEMRKVNIADYNQGFDIAILPLSRQMTQMPYFPFRK